nr:MAG: hypothetical protein DIU68_11895 [Chloroflexota bacterium]
MSQALLRRMALKAYATGYEHVARPLTFRHTAQASHERMLALLRWLDVQEWAVATLEVMNRAFFPQASTHVGGVTLPHPLILSAGLVKGDGFTDEEAAVCAAHRRNIIPGWRSVPALVGPVEFGSFTRWPRAGNLGEVLWRDEGTQSTQNRIGLKNPGIRAAAQFLGVWRAQLPSVFGINIAPSPGADDETARKEILEALALLFDAGVQPAWLTLNLSCPNTEDDAGARQTEAAARLLAGQVVDFLSPRKTPLWIKIAPDLSDEQYRALLRVFADTGVSAVIATNTLPRPVPNHASVTAGAGGGWLRPYSLRIVKLLAEERTRHGYPVDIVASGGVLSSRHLHQFREAGAQAFQYWSALVYRGPLAAALLHAEASYEEGHHDNTGA